MSDSTEKPLSVADSIELCELEGFVRSRSWWNAMIWLDKIKHDKIKRKNYISKEEVERIIREKPELKLMDLALKKSIAKMNPD